MLKLKIEVAKNCGFCFGVKRAVKLAENSRGASSLGELIHNDLEINRLRDDFGVETIKDINELDSSGDVIVRTHGITKDDLNTLNSRGARIIDATCPFVKKPQNIAEKVSTEGYDIVIFGDINHPEVKGVMSYALSKVYVILDENELENVKLPQKIAV